MRYNILYKTTNLVNGKIYIGVHSTDNLDDGYLGSGLALRAAISEYGRNNFSRTTLKHFYHHLAAYAEEELVVTEEHVLSTENYNIQIGGKGCPAGKLNPMFGKTGELASCFGRVQSEEEIAIRTRKRMDNNILHSPEANKIIREEKEKGTSHSRIAEILYDELGIKTNKKRVAAILKSIGLMLSREEHKQRERAKNPIYLEENIEIMRSSLEKRMTLESIAELFNSKGFRKLNGNKHTADSIFNIIKPLVKDGILEYHGRANRMDKKNCPICDSTFHPNEQSTKYCSRACYAKARNKGWHPRKKGHESPRYGRKLSPNTINKIVAKRRETNPIYREENLNLISSMAKEGLSYNKIAQALFEKGVKNRYGNVLSEGSMSDYISRFKRDNLIQL